MEIDIIYNKDSRKMLEVDDESIQLVITSPEYFGASMWKHNISYEKYLADLNQVWKECFRILKPDGKLIINVADISTSTEFFGRRKIYPTHSNIIKNCEEIGFDYYDFAIWYKPNREFHKVYGSYPYPTNFQFNILTEYILIFRKWVSKKYFNKRKIPPKDIKKESRIDKKEWFDLVGNVWEINLVVKINSRGENRFGHIAPFPEEIPRRLIKLYSFKNDVVLDPFTGSGTVAVVAKAMNRYYIGYEINKDYYELSNNRLLQLRLWNH